MEETKKIKLLTISDHPLIPSGVGTQTRYVIEGLLKTGKYKVTSWGAAIQHQDTRPQRVAPDLYGDNWTIFPINGYGNRDMLRSAILNDKPDALFIVTDPRFYTWLFEMADEVKMNLPIIYWHVWDNDPTPEYNDAYYNTIDTMVPLSLKTYGLLQDMKKLGLYHGDFTYVPHAVPGDVFKPVSEAEVINFRRARFGQHWDRKFIVFWNNRNARRKQSGDVIACVKKFADIVGKNNVSLMMQTQPKDPEGQDLIAVAKKFNFDNNIIMSEARVTPEDLNMFYNAADVTLNIASNEGFGLGTLESLMAGTPIAVHMTGGLQFQIGDWYESLTDFTDQDKLASIAKSRWQRKEGKWFGVPIFPGSRSCTGSQPVPYIYDDRVNHDDVVVALKKLYDMGRDERKALGLQAREWATKTFNMEKMTTAFDQLVVKTIVDHKKPLPRFVTL